MCGRGAVRGGSKQKNGYRKSAAVLLLTVALLLFGGDSPLFLPVSAAKIDPADTLLRGLLACADAIDLRGASLPAAEVGRLYLRLLHSHPELFHIAPRLSYGYTEAGGIRTVTEVYPVYTLTGKELAEARGFFVDTVKNILADMAAAFGSHTPAEAEIALYLHDLLADRYAYDTRPESEANADAYRFFRDGRGLCQAYALAYLALCRAVGLEADLVVSDAMDHAWNHVKVGGEWYHVDVTRDDPIPNEEGEEEVNHRRFLRSDAGMKALGYHGYSCAAGHACGDTRFESDGEAALDGFSKALTRWGNGWAGVQEGGGIVGVQPTDFGIIVGKSGDVNTDGEVTPADLLWVYDPALPEVWREWMRGRLVGREG